MGKIMLLLALGVRRFWIVFDERLLQQGLERVALVVGDGDEAPRRQSSVIGRARGDREDALQLLGSGAGAHQLARLSRAARFEQRQDR